VYALANSITEPRFDASVPRVAGGLQMGVPKVQHVVHYVYQGCGYEQWRIVHRT